MNAEDAEIIENWFLRRNIGEETQTPYLTSLNEFCSLIQKTPSELYKEADQQEEKGVRPIKTKVYIHLLKYKKHLIDTGKAKKTIKLYFSAVRSFYLSFDITLPKIELDKGDIGLEKNRGRPLKRKDVKRLANSAPLRERALIYLMAMTGMGQQEARNLTIKTFIDSATSAIGRDLDDVFDLFKFEDEILKEVLTLNVVRQKTNYEYITFVPPEASREIIHYLKDRCYGRNEKIRVENNSDYIFTSKYGGQLSRDSIVTNFRRVGKKAGFKKDKGTYSFWRSHALRKYFISTFINKKGEAIVANFMAGHKISEIDRVYWLANSDDLKKMYTKILPYLSLDKANVKDYETKEFREIKEENKEIKEKNQALEEQLNEINKKMDDKVDEKIQEALNKIKIDSDNFADSLKEKYKD
jgi:integrase